MIGPMCLMIHQLVKTQYKMARPATQNDTTYSVAPSPKLKSFSNRFENRNAKNKNTAISIMTKVRYGSTTEIRFFVPQTTFLELLIHNHPDN